MLPVLSDLQKQQQTLEELKKKTQVELQKVNKAMDTIKKLHDMGYSDNFENREEVPCLVFEGRRCIDNFIDRVEIHDSFINVKTSHNKPRTVPINIQDLLLWADLIRESGMYKDEKAE